MVKEEKAVKKERHCPYCDEALLAEPAPFCKACGVAMLTCPECHKPVARDKTKCPSCGVELKGK